MNTQKKAQSDCDVKVCSDHSTLRLQFPKRHTPLWEMLDGKSLKGKPKYLYLGKHGFSDNPEDRKRAAQIAIAMEADLDHPEWEKLFDPTLAKYGLGGGKYAKLANVLQLPGTKQPEPEMTVGAMWEDYLTWKEGRVEPTTFKVYFSGGMVNALKGLVWDRSTKSFKKTGCDVWNNSLSIETAKQVLDIPIAESSKLKLLQALNEAFLRAQSLGAVKLTINPFFELWKQAKPDIRDTYKPTITTDGEIFQWWQIADSQTIDEEEDRRAFTREERDVIIKAFYESDKPQERQSAHLIEFLFLTGCRPGEAFALRWGDVMLDRGIIRFSKSYSGRLKNTQTTKTKEVRIFYLYPKLADLLNQIMPATPTKTTDLVFADKKGSPFYSNKHSAYWLGTTIKYKGVERHYPGVVTRLIEEGKISGYLSPYHTRHTYITLTAQANKENNQALLHIASSCGNSVDVLLKHYLGVKEEAASIVHI